MEQVYFIYEKGGEYCKIGVSKDSNERIKQLQTGNKTELILYAYIESMDAYGVEGYLHKRFAHARMKGEWFYLPIEIIHRLVEFNINFIELEDEISEETYEGLSEELEDSVSDEIEDELEDEIEEVSEEIVEKTTRRTTRRIKNDTGKTYKCEKCSKTFTRQQYLKSHQIKVPNCIKVHSCDKCQSIFNTPSHLKAHQNRKTPCKPHVVSSIENDNPTNKCYLCNKELSSKSSLNRHKKACKQSGLSQNIIKLLEENKKKSEARDLKFNEIMSILNEKNHSQNTK